MSSIVYQDYMIGKALGAFDDSFGFWSDDDTIQQAMQTLNKSDDYFQSGNFKAAAVEFYNVHDPSVGGEELQAVTEFLANLNHPITKRNSQKQMACIVFADCEHNEDSDKSQAFKRLHVPWVISKANQAIKRVIQDLALGFATDRFGRYIKGYSPRSVCQDGACFSWHKDVPQMPSSYASSVVYDLLNSYPNMAALSAKAALGPSDLLGQIENVCVSNRAEHC